MRWPEPTRNDHDRFCRTEGWRRTRDARDRVGTHHVTYELDLPDGRVLRTRISHPVDRSGYGPGLWSHILRDQLDVSEEEFWSCVQGAIKPDRGVPVTSERALPAELVHLLIHRVGLLEAEVAVMSKEEAVARIQKFWSEGT